MANLRKRLQKALGNQYALDRELGRGAMAVVFLAERRADRTKVAVKVMDPDLTLALATERFRREIRISASLKHECIVSILEHREDRHLIFYVMEYVDGESLRDCLSRDGRLPLRRAVSIACDVGNALHYAHGKGVIHRDVKPENILLAPGHARVTDFGVARAIIEAREDVLTEPGIALGTPHYMSPEQARGARRLDGRSDVYSLGCVLFEMLVGEPPFTGEASSVVMARRVMEDPPHVRDRMPELPKALDHALWRALATNPKKRLDSAAQLVEALSGLIT